MSDQETTIVPFHEAETKTRVVANWRKDHRNVNKIREEAENRLQLTTVDVGGVDVTIEEIGPIMFADDVEPWERQPEESDRQWRAFTIFRDLPPTKRTIREVERRYHGNNQVWNGVHLKAWCRLYRWDERVLLYSRYNDAKIRNELEARRMEARLAAADLGAELRTKAAEAAKVLKAVTTEVLRITDPSTGKTEVKRVRKSNLTPSEIAKLAQTGIELERMAISDEMVPTTGMQQTNIYNLGNICNVNVPDDELVRLAGEIIDGRARDVTPTSSE